jgi:hypothetical protein
MRIDCTLTCRRSHQSLQFAGKHRHLAQETIRQYWGDSDPGEAHDSRFYFGERLDACGLMHRSTCLLDC